jgi:hypothetical protein
LRAIVNELVSDDSQKQAYLAFARELAISVRREPMALVIPREPIRQAQGRLRDSMNLAARQTGRDPSIGVGVTKGRDPSQSTKRIVAKWFGRGLHGNLLWLIGEAIRGEARMTKSE